MIYKLQGVDQQGRFVELEFAADSELDAEQLGRQQNLKVMRIAPKRGLGLWLKPRQLRARFPLLMFNQELLSLMQAGLSIVESIEALSDKEPRPENRRVLHALLDGLRQGKSLSAAFESQPQAFSRLYIATIRSSEKTGSLVDSLSRFVAYQSRMEAIKKKLISALIYPALLVVVGSLVVLFLLAYVIPKFSVIYADAGRDLPAGSRLLIGLGELIASHGAAIFLVLSALVASGVYALSQPQAQAWIKERLWNMPIIGDRMRIYQLTRYYRTLGMLVGAGIPIAPALEQVSGLLEHRMQDRLKHAVNQVREGQPLSRAMESSGLSTPVALRFLRVGERSGQMAEMLNRTADFHEEEFSRWIDWAGRLFEPLLMTAIGLVIGLIIIMMYLPIFDLAGSIQ